MQHDAISIWRPVAAGAAANPRRLGACERVAPMRPVELLVWMFGPGADLRREPLP